MASNNPRIPSNAKVSRNKELNLFLVVQAAQYGLYKWCRIFGVMTKAKREEKENKLFREYVEALRI